MCTLYKPAFDAVPTRPPSIPGLRAEDDPNRP
jgi:hypothetical protein